MLQEVLFQRRGEAFQGYSIKKHKQVCPHNCLYEDLPIQYGTGKQARENVLKQVLKKKEILILSILKTLLRFRT